jgi:hypothetical protein
VECEHLRGLDHARVLLALEGGGVDAGDRAEEGGEVVLGDLREHEREERDHADPGRAADALAGLLDREEVARAPVEVRDDHVAEPLGGERAAEVLEDGDRGGGAEEERARLRQRIDGRVDQRQLDERPRPVGGREEADHALGEALALERVGPEREVRPVDLERRARHEDDRARPVDPVEAVLGDLLPAQDRG